MEKLQSEVIRTAHDLWLKGWAERNAGNLSVRLLPGELDEDTRRNGPWRPLATTIPELGGEHFLFTDTGSHMRLVELDPLRSTSVIELDANGECFRLVRGDAESGPTSEIMPHLRVHTARKRVSGSADRAVIGVGSRRPVRPADPGMCAGRRRPRRRFLVLVRERARGAGRARDAGRSRRGARLLAGAPAPVSSVEQPRPLGKDGATLVSNRRRMSPSQVVGRTERNRGPEIAAREGAPAIR